MKHEKRRKNVASSSNKSNRIKIYLTLIAAILTVAAIAAVITLSYSGFGGASSVPEESVIIPEGNLCVKFLDVGQSDCILITSNDGKHVVIDAGTYERPGYALSLLDSYGVDEIAYLILTHPDADHIGDADEMISVKKVKNVIMTNEASDSSTFKDLISSLESSSDTNVIEGFYGNEFCVGSVKFSIISPSDRIYAGTNNGSIVVMVEYGKTKFLFTGDAEKEAEEEMIKILGKKLDCDVLKIGHHGSSSSSSQLFLEYASPSYAVISCGENNDYDHPHDEILKRLKKLGIDFYRTDKSGTITFTSDGLVIGITTER